MTVRITIAGEERVKGSCSGGLGSRCAVDGRDDKHLLPVKPAMIYIHPACSILEYRHHDCDGGEFAGVLLSSWERAFGLKHINYTYQEGEGGIAAALALVEHFAGSQPVCVILGDNIIQGNIGDAVSSYREQGGGAKILLKKVPDPQRFGVPELDGKRVGELKKNPPAESDMT